MSKAIRVLHTSECQRYRIIEVPDETSDIEDLKGDIFKPECNPSIHPKILKNREESFTGEVELYGVFGYALEIWDPTPNMGWQHLDSCYGFVGRYIPNNSRFSHYILEELKQTLEVYLKRVKS